MHVAVNMLPGPPRPLVANQGNDHMIGAMLRARAAAGQ
jgi:hypothetical protein